MKRLSTGLLAALVAVGIGTTSVSVETEALIPSSAAINAPHPLALRQDVICSVQRKGVAVVGEYSFLNNYDESMYAWVGGYGCIVHHGQQLYLSFWSHRPAAYALTVFVWKKGPSGLSADLVVSRTESELFDPFSMFHLSQDPLQRLLQT